MKITNMMHIKASNILENCFKMAGKAYIHAFRVLKSKRCYLNKHFDLWPQGGRKHSAQINCSDVIP